MREAKFVLPYAIPGVGGDGHRYARQALLKTFGGFTSHYVYGEWAGPDGTVADSSCQFVVAMDEGYGKFRAIALEAGRLEKQQAVYIVDPTGQASIIDIQPGKTDRIVEPDPGPRRPQVDEVWLSRDGKNKLLVTARDSNTIYCRVIKGSYASPIAQITFRPDGTYMRAMEDTYHYLDLVEYVTTI